MTSSPAWSPSRLLALLLSVAMLLAATAMLGPTAAHAVPTTVSGAAYDSLGDPLAGVSVEAHPPGDTSTVISSATTDGDGNYALNLPAGDYTLRFSLTGYEATWYGSESAPAGITVSPDGGVSVDGEPVEEGFLDFVTLTSTTVHTLSGTVESTGGEPLAGIGVALFGDPEDEEPLSTASTDDGGYFQFSVRAGYYFVRFTDPTQNYVDRWYATAEPEPVTVNDDVDLGTSVMTAGSATSEYPIAGRVTDVLGVGINNLTVTVTGVGATPGTATGTTSGPDEEAGGYSVAVRPGTYQVSFAGTGFVSDSYASQVTVAMNGALSVQPEDDILNNRLPDMLLASTPFSVTGEVVADATSAPLSGITVSAHNDDEPIAATTTPSGGYTLDLPIGAYNLEFADLDQLAPHYVTTWLGGSMPATVWVNQGGVVTIDDGDAVATLPTVRLAQAEANTTYPVRGTVEDLNGDPIDGVTVTAVPLPGTNPLGSAASAVTGAAPGDPGQFELALKAGTYQITVPASAEFAAGFLANEDEEPPTKARVVVGSSTITVDSMPVFGGDVGVVVLRGSVPYPVSGTATDGEAGLPGITVEAWSVYDDAVAATTTTNASGAFSFAGPGSSPTTTHGLPVGSYKLRFTDRTSNAVRYRDAWFGGEVPAEVLLGQGGVVTVDGETADLRAELTAVDANSTFDVVGMVYDPAYEPLDGVTVTASPRSGAEPIEVLTGPDATFGTGVYRLPLPAGQYRLEFKKTGFQSQQLVNPETGAPVTVTVSATGSISAPGLELYDGLIDDVQLFFPAAAFATKPKLTGKLAVGQTVSVDPGSLVGATIDTDSAWVEWFLDGKPADDFTAGSWGQKFKITAAAANRALTYTVTIDDPDGLRASTVFTSKPVTVPQAPATLQASVKKSKLTVTVSVPTWSKPTGTLIVKDGKKVIATITLKPKDKGTAVVSLAKLKPGKHKLKINYTGPASVQPAKTKLTYKK